MFFFLLERRVAKPGDASRKSPVLTAGPRPDASLSTSPAGAGSVMMAAGLLTGLDSGLTALPAVCLVTDECQSLVFKTIKKFCFFFKRCLGWTFYWSLHKRSEIAKQTPYLIHT